MRSFAYFRVVGNHNNPMWEELKVYKQLQKKDINPAFKKFGKALISNLEGYTIDQTNSLIKIFRQINQLEQSIFIEKSVGSYDLRVITCIKPIDFYKHYRFTMINIVPLGEIMNNFRRTSFPLTQEWNELAVYLATRVKNEIDNYFQTYDSYEKIIARREEIEPKNSGLDNKYELLIYAAIRTRNKSLFIYYIDKKLINPTIRITHSEFLKPTNEKFDEKQFLERIRVLAEESDFDGIEKEIEMATKSA